MNKFAEYEESLFDQIGQALDKYTEKAKNLGDDVVDYFNPPDGETTSGSAFWRRGAKPFIKDWGIPATATTLGAAGLAGGLTASRERRGEDKKERAARILKNMLLAGGGTGLAWGAAAGLSGINAAEEFTEGLSEDHKFTRLSRMGISGLGASAAGTGAYRRFSRPNNLTPREWKTWRTTTPSEIDLEIENHRRMLHKPRLSSAKRRMHSVELKNALRLKNLFERMDKNPKSQGYKFRRSRGGLAGILAGSGGFYGGSILNDLIFGKPGEE